MRGQASRKAEPDAVPATAVTAYRTSKIAKYWREGP